MHTPAPRARRRQAGSRAPFVAAITLGVGLIALGAGGCTRDRPLDSPEEAFEKLVEAGNTADSARLFDALDTPTQWAIETVHKAQREMRELIVSRYPAGERDRALARVPGACEEDLERPRRYYRRLDESRATLEEVNRRLHLGTGQPIGSVRKQQGIAEVWREGGSVFHFFRDDKGRWGFMEQREVWERAKERALHELETVKQNAALYGQRQEQRQQPPGEAPSPTGTATPAAR